MARTPNLKKVIGPHHHDALKRSSTQPTAAPGFPAPYPSTPPSNPKNLKGPKK
jgi:hypothetical protein